jgi:hypothetical protein
MAGEEFPEKEWKRPYPSLKKLARKRDGWHEGRERKKK